MAKYCWSLALKSMAHNDIAHDIVGKKQSIRYYFAFSQKPRKLIGNNVTRNNCDKVFGMGCLNYSCISNASTS